MSTFVKIDTLTDGGVSIDAVEELLTRAVAGEDMLIFTAEGAIVYANSENHNILEIG